MFRALRGVGVAVSSLRFLRVDMPFYAVRAGRKPGVYSTWDECKEQVDKFPQARYKKFPTEELALEFVNEGGKKSTAEKRSHDDDDQSDKSGGKKSKSSGDDATGWTGTPFDNPDAASVYTDGCCFMNGKQGAVAGIGVYWGPGSKDNVSERLSGRATNNRAEILAAVRAVEQTKEKGKENLVIHTDSEFLINSVTKWFKGWKKRGWKKANGDEVANKEEYQELDEVLDGMNVKWIHVRGHQGIPGNEAADKLANDGARKKLDD